MANDFIQVGTEGTGKRMDAESFIRGAATTIFRERVQVGGTSDTDIVLPTTAAPDAAAFAMPVRVAGSAQVSGAVSVSAMPAVSGTVTVQGAVTVQTQLGTQVVSVVPGVSVTVQQGVSVSAQVSGTVSVVAPGSTTGSSGMSGLLVWLGASQSLLATVVTQLGTQIVSVVPGLSVTIQQGASVSAVVSGTVTVITPGSTTGSSGMSGLLVWLGANQTLATVGTVATILGTQIVSVVPGLSVTIQQGASVSVLPLYSTTATPAAAATGEIVWVANPGAAVATTVLTVQTILGTAVVSVVPGLSVSAVVSGTVSNVGLLFTTGMATVASTGQIVVPKDFARQPVVVVISSTVVGSSTTMLMTVYTGATLVVTGTSAWPVPAGLVFRVMNMNIVAVSSAVLSQANFVVIVGTAAASVSVVATVGIAAVLPFAIEASTAPFALGAYLADVVGATTVGVGIQGGTSCSILGAVISGYLF